MSIDALVMGTSHMNAFQVMPEDNTSNLLQKFYEKRIYNIGLSGHDILTSASNLKLAIKKYSPLKYVVVEALRVSFFDEELTEVLKNTYPSLFKGEKKRNVFINVIRQILFKNHAAKFLYSNAVKYFKEHLKEYFPNKKHHNTFLKNNPELLNQVLHNMSATVTQSGAKLIIAYHPTVSLNQDGTLKIESNPEVVKQFSELCAENGIYFLDMSERFLTEYEKDFTLPYGFFNSSVAKGHMNKDGHRMFAEEIYKLMQRIEEK